MHAILRAAHFAAECHAGQRRKGANGEPYINHLLEVASLVAGVLDSPDEHVVIAALLHDTIEDTGVTREQLTREFGADVASLVVEVTDDKSLPKAERKRLQIASAPHKSRRAQLIKIADKISNLRSIVVSPPPEWSYERKREYFEWARRVVEALPEPHPALLAEFARAYERFQLIAE
ncbi:MAG: bifunctional (p)ppGpp synthetase/guanosine-3',5'-bis(diphosphate) 3'-pyrophosphohydrolase [Acidobacteria bacterium]|nr:bifunctional (p)ppGpp synthetase/guanosine-3',5'-bis(diphosphate) 3'-pyrophosphohydrolase [Acidobacteriota bacterium]